jgi:hypothetical protein
MRSMFERLRLSIGRSLWRPVDPVTHTQINGSGANRSLQASSQCENPAGTSRWVKQAPNLQGKGSCMLNYKHQELGEQPLTPAERTLSSCGSCCRRKPCGFEEPSGFRRCPGCGQARHWKGGTSNG